MYNNREKIFITALLSTGIDFNQIQKGEDMLHTDTSYRSNIPHPQPSDESGTQQDALRDSFYNIKEIDRLIEAETDKILNHVSERLPKEVVAHFGGVDGIKKQFAHSFSQNYHEMLSRYIATAEDEMVKKVHQLIDREEMKMLNRSTPKEIATLLEQAGGADKFTTAEMEKSIVSMYGHLHGYMQRGISDLEASTNALLRQKTDVGSFIRGENAYSVVKCTFKDNTYKPKTVTDVKLSVNILDSELISPIFQYQVTAEYLIKDLISNHFMDLIDKEIEQVKDQLIDEGKEELTDSEIVFAKLNKVADITDDDADNPAGKRYTAVSKELMSRLSHLHAEIDPQSFDQLNIRENIKRIIDSENIRNRGFNTAVNALTSILDNAKMGYQYIENLKNARQLIIREYDDMHEECLPDERYQIHLRYFDHAQLNEERKAYEIMIRSFEARIDHLWDVMQASYDKSKWKKGLIDFADLSRLYRRYIKKKYKDPAGEPSYEDEDISKVWDGVSFVSPAETEVEKMNRTFVYEKEKMAKKLTLMRERLQKMYVYQYPPKRRIMEEQLDFLETELQHFDYKINPFHLQPGLLLDIDITSIKRKRITLEAMANVINDFLHAISKGFTDQARASFNRRRSVLHTDFDHAFGGADDSFAADGTDAGVNPFDMLDELPDSSTPAADTTVDEYTDAVVHDTPVAGNRPQEENDPLPDADDIHTPAIKRI